ncbi:hypothetical protein QVD17_37172 [Tagetes erecta]|uniref:Legume lectin domain-containing protein n=1 Tax=Tagetes erecta TaxID=13708 RepID=A0AAD8K014_TARER|nr:hypothetical protein QVD17_37172 [Tagetes erecta]
MRMQFFIVLLFLVIHVNSVSFKFSSFQPNNQMIMYQGDAFTSSGIQVTKNQRDKPLTNSVGRALYSDAVQIWDKKTRKLTDFITHFSFSMNALNSSIYGDGLSFFLMPFEPEIPTDSFGGYLGLFSPASAFNSSNNTVVAVEFDSFENKWDPSDNHVGINVNSIISVANVSWSSSIKDGRTANAWVSYNSSTCNLSVFLSYDDEPFLSSAVHSSLWYVVDLREVLPEWVRIGFSAATGDWIETHTVFSWSFNSSLGETKVRVKKNTWLTTGLATGSGALSLMVGLLWLFLRKKRSLLSKRSEDNDYDLGSSIGPKRYSFHELKSVTQSSGGSYSSAGSSKALLEMHKDGS